MKYIFVQIPSYRELDILPTIRDCISKASNPRRLRFGICWQHDKEDDSLSMYNTQNNFNILMYDWRDSRGVCWARNKIQDLYDGEEYILQLDAHHRFVQDWDKILLKMIKETGSDKPILTTYGTPFYPQNPDIQEITPCRIGYHGFAPQGVVHLKPYYMENYRSKKQPEPARYFSGHFAFTTGDFISECPYDPDLYFHGEEITMAVRSYTHGYDLFHPHKLILWHDYSKVHGKSHWIDHTPENIKGKDAYWYKLEFESVKRIRKLLHIPPSQNDPEQITEKVDIGKYGLGTVRSLRDYEKFAGINFKLRSAHRYTIDSNIPPNPHVVGGQNEWDQSFEQGYTLIPEFNPGEIDSPGDCKFWYVGLHDAHEKEIYRKDIGPEQIKNLLRTNPLRLCLRVTTLSQPRSCTIWPYSSSRGWTNKTVKLLD